MKFGPVPVSQAVGAISAHSVMLGHEKGLKKIKKGQIITSNDVARLREEQIETIIVARLEEGDIHEDAAASRLGLALIGGNVRVEEPFTGRVNLIAVADGVLFFDAQMLNNLNSIEESITCATLAPFARVRAGQMVATVKIIPFSVETKALDIALGFAAPISVSLFKAHRAGLVATHVPGVGEKVLDKTTKVLRKRLEGLGSALGEEIRCAHETQEIALSVSKLIETGHDPVIVFGASAIVDRRDMVPSGIEAAGGTIDHFGMPVDPGNLLLMAHKEKVRIIGAPGCARSPKENGFDLVLERMLAGLKVTSHDVTAMGAGGLYKEIESRPQPRALRRPDRPMGKKRVAAIILSAGQSRRMGRPNKLLQNLGGRALVRHAVETALASPVQEVVVVTGHEEREVRAALQGLEVRFAHNEHYDEGLSTSLRVGVGAIDESFDAVMVCLGDMPEVTSELMAKIIHAFSLEDDRLIVVPTHRGKRGNPVLFSMRFRSSLLDATGDSGARHLLGANEDVIYEIEADESVALDIDTKQALDEARRRFEKAD